MKDADGNIIKTKLTENGYCIAAEDGEETFAVDENGCAEFRYLKVGNYEFVESTPVGYIAKDEYPVELTTANGTSNPYSLDITNTPTGLHLRKVIAHTDDPLTGTGFCIKVKDGIGFEALTFTQQKDGTFFFDENGKIMDLMVNENGELTIYGLPLGSVWIEESIVPEGYFPIPAVKAEITKETSADAPLEITIENNKFVKLGMDSDWWEFPALMMDIALAIGGTVTFIVLKRKKRKQEV